MGETGLGQEPIRHIVIVVAGLTASLLPWRTYPPAHCLPPCCGRGPSGHQMIWASMAERHSNPEQIYFSNWEVWKALGLHGPVG